MRHVMPVMLVLGLILVAANLVRGARDAHAGEAPVAPAAVAHAPEIGSAVGACGMIPKTLRQLAQESEAVVLARVVGNHCAWDADHKLIWTTTDLEVTDTWKGAPLTKVAVDEPGGEVPPMGIAVSTAVRYRPGAQVVVFLSHDPMNHWRTHGVWQGMFEVAYGDDHVLRPILAGISETVAAGEFDVAAPDLARFRDRVIALTMTTGEKK